jgi:hypothetical protein
MTNRLSMLATALMLSLGNRTPVCASSITGTVTQQQLSDVNLTTQGTIDWAVWGQGASASLSPTDSMSGGSGISDLSDITNGSSLRGLGQFGDYGESTFRWTNGANTSSATGVPTGIQNNASYGFTCSNVQAGACGEGFSFNVAAGSTLEELTLYDTVNVGSAQLTAKLSDNSAPELVQNFTGSSANTPFYSTIDFFADNPGQFLTITVVLTADNTPSGTSNVAIQGATLSSTTPEPSALALFGAGAAFTLLIGLKLRKRQTVV